MKPKFNYSINVTKSMENARKQGINDAIEMFAHVTLAMLYDADWSSDEAQEFVNRITRGIVYYSQHPDDYHDLVEEHKQIGILAEFL